ncbi:hypothetical protein BH11ARM2_BH11ARM2_36240 [soil metagenome]
MRGEWIGLLLSGGMLNAFALFVGSQAYTAWSIRVRNEMYWFLLRRPVNRERADSADEIADGVVRWFRPLLLFLVNSAWLLLVWSTIHKSRMG